MTIDGSRYTCSCQIEFKMALAAILDFVGRNFKGKFVPGTSM